MKGIDREVISERPGQRVTQYRLAPGREIPWHYHLQVADSYLCEEGEFLVEQRGPGRSMRLRPGDMAEVSVRTVHRVVNIGSTRCSFRLTQGPGSYDFNLVQEGRDDPERQ
ncbi:MAG: cupin domain-containing protein [Sphingomonadales bacterium]